MSLKKKVLNYLNENKSAQGSLIAVVAASVILSVIVASATQWYLAFNKSLNVSSDSLTGMSIAKDIWDKMTTQDFADMKGKAGTTETSNVGGYTVTREYGQAGVFDESTGECKVGSGSPTTDNPRACMDVTIKVTDKDGKQVFTATPTRVSQNLGNFYVKNDNFPKEFKVKMEDKDESVEMPEGKALYAYVDGQKVPLSSQGGAVGNPELGWTKLSNGLILQWGVISNLPTQTTITISLPIAFTSACYVAFTQSAQTSRSNSYNNSGIVLAKSTNTITIIKDEAQGDMYWMAIGK